MHDFLYMMEFEFDYEFIVWPFEAWSDCTLPAGPCLIGHSITNRCTVVVWTLRKCDPKTRHAQQTFRDVGPAITNSVLALCASIHDSPSR